MNQRGSYEQKRLDRIYRKARMPYFTADDLESLCDLAGSATGVAGYSLDDVPSWLRCFRDLPPDTRQRLARFLTADDLSALPPAQAHQDGA